MNSRLTFGAVGAAALIAVGGVALAATPDTPSTTTTSDSSITLPAGGVLANRVTTFCRHSDETVARLQKRQAKIEKRIAHLKEHNYPKRAEALQKRLTEVPKAAAECDALGLG